MWNRSELKQNAKKILKTSYWRALLVALIAFVLNGGGSGISRRFDKTDVQSFSGAAVDWTHIFGNFWLLLILISLSIAAVVAVFFKIFISTTVQVGEHRWFSRNREAQANPSIGQMFSLFRGNNWMPTVGAMLWMYFWLWAWSLLPAIPVFFGIAGIVLYLVLVQPIILPAGFDWGNMAREWSRDGWRPGQESWNWQNRSDTYQYFQETAPKFWADNQNTLILIAAMILAIVILSLALSIPLMIKNYAYRMTPWILADNPQIGYRRALKLSRQMMRGQKFNLLILDLSFIGWYILGLIAFVIGALFVRPYHQATVAELYAVLRRNSVSQGLATMEDFGFRTVNASTQANAVAEQPSADRAFETPTEPVPESSSEVVTETSSDPTLDSTNDPIDSTNDPEE